MGAQGSEGKEWGWVAKRFKVFGVQMPLGCLGFAWEGGLEKGETSLEAKGFVFLLH